MKSSAKVKAHLSLISESSSKQRGAVREIIGTENLSAEQYSLAKKYLTDCGLTGAFIGALLGTEKWDVRPIIIQNSNLAILRLGNPSLALNIDKLNYLRSFYSQAKLNLDLQRFIINYGDIDGQFWVLRRFHQNTFANVMRLNNASTSLPPVQQAQQLIALVASLHKAGIIHGHINQNNIGADADTPSLLDFGFAAHEPSDYADLAPEIAANEPASLATDIYGLGLVLKELLQNYLSETHAVFIEKMLSTDPAERPSISEVRSVFAVESSVKPSDKATAPTTPIATGNIIKGTAISAQPKARKEVAPKAKPTLLNVPRPELPAEVATPSKATYQRDPLEERLTATRKPTVTLNRQAPVETFRSINSYPVRERVIQTDVPSMNSAPTQTPPPSATTIASSTQQISNTRFLTTVALFTALIAVVLSLTMFHLSKKPVAKVTYDYNAYWLSEQPSLQEQVVVAAVLENDFAAQGAITEAALKGTKIKGVRDGLLKVAFNSAWIKTLSQNDKNIVYALSLEKPPASVLNALPPIVKAQPGVIFAILSQIEGNESSLTNLPTTTFASLPSPYGEAFMELDRLGIKKVGQPEVKGLIGILSNRILPNTVGLLFNGDSTGKLAPLLPFLEAADSSAGSSFIAAVRALGPNTLPTLEWFFEESDVDWNNVAIMTKLKLAAGVPAFDGLTLEHELDLISYPDNTVRMTIIKKVIEFLDPVLKPILEVIKANPDRLNRAQTTTLISALSYKGANSNKYIASWFGMKPDPQIVFNFLMARNSVGKNDFFNLESARYLADKEWDADFDTLKQMSVHLEPVARALAYSKIDPTDPIQLRFLRKMSNIEPSNVVRQGILDKIKPFEGRSTLKYQPVTE